jgi:hypothetical protein
MDTDYVLLLQFSVACLAIAYGVADLLLNLYVWFRKGAMVEMGEIAGVIGFSPLKTLRRIFFVHSRIALAEKNPFLRFLYIVLRFTTVPTLFGVVALMTISFM